MLSAITYSDDWPRKSLSSVILETLQASGETWLTRQEIAHRIGRPARLTTYDIKLLERLVSVGKVERKRKLIGTVRTAFVYRAIAE